METNSLPSMIMMSLVNTQAEVLALKDFLMEDYILRNNIDENGIKKIMESRKELVKEYQTNLIAQIRERYDTNLGSVDDLIKDL